MRRDQKLILVLLFGAPLVVPSVAAQMTEASSTCKAEYQDRNQIDQGPLIVQEITRTVADSSHVAVPKACVALFTENDHKLLASVWSGDDGGFSLQSAPPGRYRVVVKRDALSPTNVRVRIYKVKP
jgi:hypothetical protein